MQTHFKVNKNVLNVMFALMQRYLTSEKVFFYNPNRTLGSYCVRIKLLIVNIYTLLLT